MAFTLNVASSHPQISSDVSSLQYSLTSLKDQSSFDDIVEDLNRLDKNLTHAVDLLESAREKGYHYQKDLDDLAYEAMSEWEDVYNQTLAEIERQEAAFQGTLTPLNSQVRQLNVRLNNPTSAARHLRTTETTVNGLLGDVSSIRRNIENNYSDIESKVSRLNSRLSTIHWVLGQLDEARFQLEGSEDIVMAVPARWDQVGDDDPEGILYLSNERLIFERKEKVATKKILFITTSSELVQEVMISEPTAGISGIKAVSKGLFGHQDFLEVKFAKTGTVPFHLDGQDSKEWATLVQRVQNGSIEDDHTTGSALSFKDLTGNITQADIVTLQNEVNDLQDELMLKDARAELEELENDVRSLERDLGDVRARGYVIESDLEGEAAVLVSQWERVKENAGKTLEHQAGLLSEQMTTITEKMARLAGLAANPAAARPLYMQLKSTIASSEAQADAAEDTVLAQFDEYADEVEGLAAHLDWIDWMLDALATASFQLLATESGVAATEAVWAAPGLEPENGVLYLTDQRLLWEDRVGEYELKVDVPLQSITDVKIETGEEEDDELLVFIFDGNAPLPNTRFELASPVGDDWIKMVGRARSGDYARDRAVEIDEAELERVKNAPTSCPNCSAAFTSPVLRGQTEITCEWCGVVTRL